MIPIQRALLIVLSLALTACAIHPLPENVTGVSTARIVHRIRCEAREAVTQAAAEFHSQKRLQTLESVGIVYSYALTGMETDGLSASATVIQPLTNGMWNFNPSLGDSLTRQNVRAFTVVDNFQTLIHQMDERKCEAEPTGPNYQYPITGRIGVAEMIRTFINMAMHENLGAEQGTSVDVTASGPPAMVDTITFTTTVSAGITPTITLNPAGMATQLGTASLAGTLMRTDTHQVIIGLGLPAKIPAQAASARFGMLVSASPRTNGEATALAAVNSQILRFQVTKPLIVTP